MSEHTVCSGRNRAGSLALGGPGWAWLLYVQGHSESTVKATEERAIDSRSSTWVGGNRKGWGAVMVYERRVDTC